MLMRLVIRFAASLIGIAAGLLICGAALTQFHIDAAAVIESTLLFWVIHMIVQLIALRVLVREPSIALAGLLALASTIISLIIVAAIIPGLTIHHLYTYALATIIIWITTALADMIGRRIVRARRADRREAEKVR